MSNELPSENLPKDVREEIIRRMIKDQNFRFWLCSRSLYWFIQYYFHDPGFAETPEFHRQIIHDLEKLESETYVLAAGRGMGKSTLALCYVLWRILHRKERLVALFSKTDRQVTQMLENARIELEDNNRLLNDYGPVKGIKDKWGRTSGLEVGNYDAKIIGNSMEQSIRGMKHQHDRPGLFLLDDVEDSLSVRSAEAREKVLELYQRDIVPAGDERTKIIILGGILQNDSFVAHMKELILSKKLPGTYREYPFLDKDGKALWPERYPTQESIDQLRLKIGSDIAWRQEYLLQIISTEHQIIPYEWFEGQDYDELPDSKDLSRIVISVDPASSKKKRADYTAIVVFIQYHVDNKWKIYVHPHPINERLSGMEIEETVAALYKLHGKQGPVEVLIETTSQNYLGERLMKKGVHVRECRPRGDKAERLRMAGAPLQAKMVFFHRTDCEDLKLQLVGFGYERFDDLVDAFSQGINEIMTQDPNPDLNVYVLG